MAESAKHSSKKLEKLLEETNALLRENIELVKEEVRVNKGIDEKVRKVVVNTSKY